MLPNSDPREKFINLSLLGALCCQTVIFGIDLSVCPSEELFVAKQ